MNIKPLHSFCDKTSETSCLLDFSVNDSTSFVISLPIFIILDRFDFLFDAMFLFYTIKETYCSTINVYLYVNEMAQVSLLFEYHHENFTTGGGNS